MSLVTKEELKECRDRVTPRLKDEVMAQPDNTNRDKYEIKRKQDELKFQAELEKINSLFYDDYN